MGRWLWALGALCVLFGVPGTLVGGILLNSEPVTGLACFTAVLGVPLCIAGRVVNHFERRSHERHVATLERSGWWQRCRECAGTGEVTWEQWQPSPNGGGHPVRNSAPCRPCGARGVVPPPRRAW